jgi:hypothetical protein
VTHDVRVWRTATAACRAVVFDPPRNVDLAKLGFRLIREGQVTEGPVDCMSCLAARRTPYAVLCDDHGQQFLTEEQYDHQMNRPDSLWRCPRCEESAHWDDDEYDAALDEEGPDDDEADRQAT